MDRYKILCVSVIVLLAGSSCKDASKKENATDNKISTAAQAVQSSAKGIVKFKVNGQQVSTSAWNVSVSNSMNGICKLNVTSNMHEDTRTIIININSCASGSYPFSH